MFISISFSASIYQVSVRELDKGLQHQRDSFVIGLRNKLDVPLLDTQRLLIATPGQLLDDSKTTIILNLIVVNAAIFVGGGILSYCLARRTLKPIEEAHEAQRRFTADASHELRTPIAAMQTEIEVALMDKNLTLGDAKKQLNSNLEELGHLTSLSEGLLRLARLEDNDLDKSSAGLKPILDSAINRVSQRAAKKTIKIKLNCQPKLSLMADRAILEESFVTLLDNAIKYSPSKSDIEINAQKELHNIKITIKDQGAGIDKKDLPHIFDRFYRSDKARNKNKTDGYGLGLAIAKKIIVLHDGKISATSRRGNGTVFTILLPSK
jgi:signal transduction histidine kinase